MDNKERSEISKQIWRETRSQLRKYRTVQTQERLQAFSDIKHLERLVMYPVTQKKKGGPDLPKCAELLKTVYTPDTIPNYGSTCNVPPFSMKELQSAMKAMKKKKCADKDDVVF